MSDTILVAGATGGVGQQVTHQLLLAGTPVRALVRDLEKASRILDYQAELHEGDTSESQSLSAALQGIRQVICTIGSRATSGGNPEKVDYEGVRNLVEAARAGGIEHFVLVSSIGVTNPNHPINRFGNVMTWKLRGEDILRASGLTYTVVRPGGLIDDPGGRKGVRFAQGDRISGRVTRADTAAACIQALTQHGARNTTFEMINTEDGEQANWNALFASLKPDASYNTTLWE
jgi:uncharacterized protein YbjT (DUF2867 family)